MPTYIAEIHKLERIKAIAEKKLLKKQEDVTLLRARIQNMQEKLKLSESGLVNIQSAVNEIEEDILKAQRALIKEAQIILDGRGEDAAWDEKEVRAVMGKMDLPEEYLGHLLRR